MNDRRQVRVRRSPRIGVFLAIGAGIGAGVAVVAVILADSVVPSTQVIGFLILVLAPVGALLGGVVALVLDAVAERRARTIEAERLRPWAPSSPSSPSSPDGDEPR